MLHRRGDASSESSGGQVPAAEEQPSPAARRPLLVGILNVTEDSFSDGGQFLAPEAALAHAQLLADGGAHVIEVGAASSHPDAAPVSSEEELRRIQSVVEGIGALGVRAGVDTFAIETQRAVLRRGIGWLNDINGFPDPRLYEELAASRATIVVMHSMHRGRPGRQHARTEVVLQSIDRFFGARLVALEHAGVSLDRVVLDPGLGFFLSADPGPSLAVLAGIADLRARFGFPVLVSPSRKSFLRAVTDCSIADSGPPTLAAEIFAAVEGVDYIRTHDPKAVRNALAVLDAIASWR